MLFKRNFSPLLGIFINREFQRFIHIAPRYVWNVPTFPKLDLNYLCNSNNSKDIADNIARRKGVGNIHLVLDLKAKLDSTNSRDDNYNNLQTEFYNELLKIPNNTHPDVANLKEEPHVVKHIGTKREFDFKPREFNEITKRLNLVRTDQLGNLSGNRSYFVLGEMAELEQALINYTVNNLRKRKFRLISVPDILDRNIIEGCGLNTKGTRTQNCEAVENSMTLKILWSEDEDPTIIAAIPGDYVIVNFNGDFFYPGRVISQDLDKNTIRVYTLEPKMYGPNLCLSGTSEMALAGYFLNTTLSEDELPVKLAAVSRCYRAEVSSVAEERGIYRVHQFTKVEMFAVSSQEMSDELLEDFRSIEEENFSALGLHLRTLDMPPHELGAAAYRKYDIEAWLPGRNMFGEISSCSNCTDYQSRRLGIKYKTSNGLKYAHTLNGTACAIPRMLIALTETFQSDKGFFEIPEVLQKYMHNKKQIGRQKKVPELKLIKHKK